MPTPRDIWIVDVAESNKTFTIYPDDFVISSEKFDVGKYLSEKTLTKTDMRVSWMKTKTTNRSFAKYGLYGFIDKIEGVFSGQVKILPTREHVQLPPAHFVGSFLKLFLSVKDFDRTVGQQIADIREEYCDAIAEGRSGYARWLHIRGIIYILQTFILQRCVSIVNKVVELWKLTQ